MDINYNLMVLRWSIFTLSWRLMSCASLLTNQISNVVPLCPSQPAILDGSIVEASVTYELRSNALVQTASCKQILRAPESHGFYVRLYSVGEAPRTTATSQKGMNKGMMLKNATGSCPLAINQMGDNSVPTWRPDPCQLDATADRMEVAKFMASPLRIIWYHHGEYTPSYRLTITSYGKGEVCEEEGRHSCLKMGKEKHICVVNDLLCDGVQNCPDGPEFESDESVEMCEKQKETWPLKMLKEFLRKSLQKSFPSLRVPADHSNATMVMLEARFGGVQPPHNAFHKYNESLMIGTTVISGAAAGPTTIRKSLSRGLSKYGPWGYLMLGMLLCGGALLVCGLWECCCRKQKPTMVIGDQPVMEVAVVGGTRTQAAANLNHYAQQHMVAPAADEIVDEPPPSYSVLFPNNKSTQDLTQLASGAAISHGNGGDLPA